MHKIVKRAGAGAVLGGSLLFGGVAIASAAPGTNVDDQLVNLGVGDANFLQDVNVDVASQIAGLLCGTGVTGTANPTTPNGPNATGMSANETNVRDITALANQVDAGQIPTTTCDSHQGVVTIAQNGSVNPPNASDVPTNTPNASDVPTNTPNASDVPTNTPNANTAPATGPNAENVGDQPTGAQPAEPTAPMTPTSGLTPAS